MGYTVSLRIATATQETLSKQTKLNQNKQKGKLQRSTLTHTALLGTPTSRGERMSKMFIQTMTDFADIKQNNRWSSLSPQDENPVILAKTTEVQEREQRAAQVREGKAVRKHT